MLFLFILLAYFIFTGSLIEPLLVHLFSFKKSWCSTFLGIFLSFSLVGFLSGIFVVFSVVNLVTSVAVLVLNFLLILALRRLAKLPGDRVVERPSREAEVSAPISAWWGVLLYLVLVGYGIYLLSHSHSTGNLVTPWQTIDHFYIYIFAFATLLLAGLIFSRLPTAALLVLCIIHGALLHSYLPLTHELFYGADQWRHVAVEERLVAGRPLIAAKLSAPAATLDGKVIINASGLSVSTLAYSSFWGESALIARITKFDLITVNKWLLPILWSLFLPIMLFKIGRTLGWSEQASLFFVWLGFLPFTWQAVGSLTLPVGSGFLIWLLSVILLLKRIKQPNQRQLPFLLFFGFLSFFGYTLYLILFWLGWGVAEGVVRLKGEKKLKIFLVSFTVLLAALLIPTVEFVTHYSAFSSGVRWLHQVKEVGADLLAWHVAAGPSGGDITAGNIIFNQVPLAAFVPNVLTFWRWWLVAFMLLFLSAALAGLRWCFEKQNTGSQWLAVFGSALFLSYVISRYFLIGENIFTRRLDPVLAFFFLIFVMTTLVALNFFSLKKQFLIPLVILLSCAIAASYSLGPDTGTVSAAEYGAMRSVWGQEQGQTNRCVIADTYPLLALEAISSEDIVGGGFPINQYFAQPELVSLYRNFSGSAADWQKALALTGAKSCAFVKTSPAAGAVPDVEFGNVGVWWYPK